jgi:hypothetical protein
MDYSHTSFFAGAPPPYQFMGGAQVPLTPSHSNSVASEDFNTTSPPVGFMSPCLHTGAVQYGEGSENSASQSRASSPQLLYAVGSQLGSCSWPARLSDSAFRSLRVAVARIRLRDEGLHNHYSGNLRPVPQCTASRPVPKLRQQLCPVQYRAAGLPGSTHAAGAADRASHRDPGERRCPPAGVHHGDPPGL